MQNRRYLRHPHVRLFMSDSDSGGGSQGGEGQDQTPENAEQKSDSEELGEGGKRALTAERNARSAAEKRAREAEAEIQRLKTAGMTEQQKAEARTAALEKALADLRADQARAQIALKHKLSEADARLLANVATTEAMEELAARLAKAQAQDDERTARRSRGNYVPGAGASPTKADSDERRFVRELFG